MNKPSTTSMRQALSTLAVALLLAPLPAAALPSDGSDGEFRPTVSTVLDAQRQVFNFTDFVIPSGVVVSFSGLAHGPIFLRASGIIDIAGVLDIGAAQLWLEAPVKVSFSESPGTLAINLGSIGVRGSAPSTGGDLVVGSGGSIALTGRDPMALSTGATLPLPGAIVVDPGKLIATPAPSVELIGSGGNVSITSSAANIIIRSSPIDLGQITRISPIPEPDSGNLLLAGGGLLFGVLCWRRARAGVA